MKKLFLLLALAPVLLKAQEKPNVIYILADDLGLGDLSIYGQKKFQTPNIDSIGTEGLKFTAHYSGNTVCSPSRAVLMTGHQPGAVYLRGNVTENEVAPLDPKLTVLPEIFKAAGYNTGAYGKWGLGFTHVKGIANPLNHGFDEFVGWKSQMIAHTYYPTTYVHNGKEKPLKKGTYVHDIIMNHAMQFIESNAKSKTPFFCYIPTAVPHAAMHAPKELHAKWRKKFPQFDQITGRYKIHRGDGTETVPDVINPIAGFGAMVENLDNQIGDILALLDHYQIADNTLVIFTSDNGAHREGGHDPDFWNSTASLRGMKRDMHEGGIRTPMLVRWPAIVDAGRTTDHLSAFWDILPTMADLTKQPVPDKVDGISFLPLLKEQEQKKHDFLYFEFCKGDRQTIFSQAIRKGDWKAYRQTKKSGEMPPLEIYNLKSDPFEKKNLAKEHPEIVSQMLGHIKAARTPLPSQTE
ncbi:arylsulfatase [Akkermansiaceae bacterium]|jgi:arylsulfatase A-like enzyme|nr:arylsulfatase [Akkermansiaceae bacterium]